MEKLRSVVTWLAPPYAVLVASIYLYGYWSTFDIDLFEYTTIPEILMAALLPSLLYATAAVFGLLTSYTENPIPTNRKAHKNQIRLDIVQMVGILILVLPVCWLTDFYWILSLVLVVPTISILADLPIIQKIENRLIKVMVLVLITVVPLGTFITAKGDAALITRGEKYWAATIDGVEFRFLGHAGDKTFFTNATNDKILILPDSDASLLLTKVRRSELLDSKKKWLNELFN